MIAACVFASNPSSAGNPYGPPVALWEGSDDYILPYTTVFFADRSTGFPTSWEWKIFGGVFAITQEAQYYFTHDGDYPISLTVTNEYGSDTYTNLIHVTSV